jgi:hypothetical protein
MVYLVCIESGGNQCTINIRVGSGKSMVAQLISKKGWQSQWPQYEIGESPRKEIALNPKHYP